MIYKDIHTRFKNRDELIDNLSCSLLKFNEALKRTVYKPEKKFDDAPHLAEGLDFIKDTIFKDSVPGMFTLL